MRLTHGAVLQKEEKKKKEKVFNYAPYLLSLLL
jgi:hypothetical protein